MMKLPKQQSTCRPILCFLASFPRAVILSWHPSGKFIADPTTYKDGQTTKV